MTTATAVLSPLSASPIRMLAISGQKLQDEALSNERQFSRSQFIFYQAPARTSASFHLPPISSISSLVGIFATGKHIATPINHNRERFRQDIVSLLPPEIGVKIFEYLRPMDLCQVCLVCHRWRLLAQHDTLKKLRVNYVQTRREEYNRTKENFITATVATPNTARSPTHHLRTSTPSPLSVVQPRGSSRRTRSISLSPISSSSSSLHTPQSRSTHLVDNVKRLSISGSENSENDIRRCLFPELSPSSTPLTHHVSQDSWFFERDALVGKRVNRTRLKRL
ncbi:hypothetical protein EMCRGX_G023991 [Ephydatia muelleri]|eukprot:Em0015g215a